MSRACEVWNAVRDMRQETQKVVVDYKVSTPLLLGTRSLQECLTNDSVFPYEHLTGLDWFVAVLAWYSPQPQQTSTLDDRALEKLIGGCLGIAQEFGDNRAKLQDMALAVAAGYKRGTLVGDREWDSCWPHAMQQFVEMAKAGVHRLLRDPGSICGLPYNMPAPSEIDRNEWAQACAHLFLVGKGVPGRTPEYLNKRVLDGWLTLPDDMQMGLVSYFERALHGHLPPPKHRTFGRDYAVGLHRILNANTFKQGLLYEELHDQYDLIVLERVAVQVCFYCGHEHDFDLGICQEPNCPRPDQPVKPQVPDRFFVTGTRLAYRDTYNPVQRFWGVRFDPSVNAWGSMGGTARDKAMAVGCNDPTGFSVYLFVDDMPKCLPDDVTISKRASQLYVRSNVISPDPCLREVALPAQIVHRRNDENKRDKIPPIIDTRAQDGPESLDAEVVIQRLPKRLFEPQRVSKESPEVIYREVSLLAAFVRAAIAGWLAGEQLNVVKRKWWNEEEDADIAKSMKRTKANVKLLHEEAMAIAFTADAVCESFTDSSHSYCYTKAVLSRCLHGLAIEQIATDAGVDSEKAEQWFEDIAQYGPFIAHLLDLPQAFYETVRWRWKDGLKLAAIYHTSNKKPRAATALIKQARAELLISICELHKALSLDNEDAVKHAAKELWVTPADIRQWKDERWNSRDHA